MTHFLTPIGHIITPFTQKFSIPRQGFGLSLAKGEIIFSDHIKALQALEGIDAFSHLWILFLFHENLAKGYSDKVRPPRFGGNKKIGVFASRSSFRPNGIGMSVVENLGTLGKTLIVGGVDLLSHTPIIDIKPYIPYADCVENALGGYAHSKPLELLSVTYSDAAVKSVSNYSQQYPDLLLLINNVLAQDPRPAYKKNKPDDKTYFIQLWDIEIKWLVIDTAVNVIDVYSIPTKSTNS
jgi:tRNA-Thr(GGU) m(6)t(6)A37 methyltransferase TsaA